MIGCTLQIVLKVMKHQTATDIPPQNFTSCKRDKNIISCLSLVKQDDMSMARQALHKMMTSILFLGRQGLAIRGKTDETSNLHQLLFL